MSFFKQSNVEGEKKCVGEREGAQEESWDQQQSWRKVVKKGQTNTTLVLSPGQSSHYK
jgi:hypothetical protein